MGTFAITLLGSVGIDHATVKRKKITNVSQSLSYGAPTKTGENGDDDDDESDTI